MAAKVPRNDDSREGTGGATGGAPPVPAPGGLARGGVGGGESLPPTAPTSPARPSSPPPLPPASLGAFLRPPPPAAAPRVETRGRRRVVVCRPGSGDLLRMQSGGTCPGWSGSFQATCEHQVPREKDVRGWRIVVTLRVRWPLPALPQSDLGGGGDGGGDGRGAPESGVDSPSSPPRVFHHAEVAPGCRLCHCPGYVPPARAAAIGAELLALLLGNQSESDTTVVAGVRHDNDGRRRLQLRFPGAGPAKLAHARGAHVRPSTTSDSDYTDKAWAPFPPGLHALLMEDKGSLAWDLLGPDALLPRDDGRRHNDAGAGLVHATTPAAARALVRRGALFAHCILYPSGATALAWHRDREEYECPHRVASMTFLERPGAGRRSFEARAWTAGQKRGRG